MAGPSEAHGLDHGFFHIPKPTPGHSRGYGISAVLLIIGLFLYNSSLSIPDVPRIEEAEVLLALHDDPSDYEYGVLQKGYDAEEYASTAAFVVVPLELESGTIGYESCTWVEDDDGGGSWSYSVEFFDNSLRFRDVAGKSIDASFSRQGSLSPEGSMLSECSSEYGRDIVGRGENQSGNHRFSVFMLVEEDPVRYQLLSVAENRGFSNALLPDEVTQREDRGRWALLLSGLAGMVCMAGTGPSLKEDLKRIRKQNSESSNDTTSSEGALGVSGRSFPHFGPNFERIETTSTPARDAENDWLFGAPPLPASFEDPFKQEGDGTLIAEHPIKMGTPRPATMTPYSIGALLFATSFIWLAADLRARDGSWFHTMLGWGLTFVVTGVNLVWFYRAWKQFKLVRLVNDLPTSPVRSAAVGQVELVGQVRPSVAGTPVMEVGGRENKGLVSWRWDSYRYECTTDSDGNQSCSWNHKERVSNGVPFIVHDGSGGIIVDPAFWSEKQVDLGPVIDTWQRGNWQRGKWRWDVRGLGVGDPLYILGDCVPRTEQHLRDWGGDPTVQNALLTVVPTTGTGDASVLHLGTELDLLAQNRSIFEILIVPLFVFTMGVFMFLNYTP